MQYTKNGKWKGREEFYPWRSLLLLILLLAYISSDSNIRNQILVHALYAALTLAVFGYFQWLMIELFNVLGQWAYLEFWENGVGCCACSAQRGCLPNHRNMEQGIDLWWSCFCHPSEDCRFTATGTVIQKISSNPRTFVLASERLSS